MREIKFRGKRIDNGMVIKGYLCKIGERVYISEHPMGAGYSGSFDDKNISGWVQVYFKTVGQMLEIGDCTGKELFDGDIFIDKASKDKCPQKYVIKYGDLSWYMEPDYEPRDLFGLWERNRIKKIGTIHDKEKQIAM